MSPSLSSGLASTVQGAKTINIHAYHQETMLPPLNVLSDDIFKNSRKDVCIAKKIEAISYSPHLIHRMMNEGL